MTKQQIARYSQVTGTIRGLRDYLTKLIDSGADPNAVIRAWDSDSDREELVTGVLYSPDSNGVVICTDEP